MPGAPGGVVTLQVGQCGTQRGPSLYGALGDEITRACGGGGRAGQAYGAEVVQAWFRPPRRGTRGEADAKVRARAVLVDMEPKVVREAVRASKKAQGWQFDENRVFSMQGGSGNNWARGYKQYGERVRDRVLNLVRRELEDCDRHTGFLVTQSLAGGTGAGLGAYLGEALRDEYSYANILNYCVWPYETGEVIVQSYNTVLSLASLLEHSDGVVLAANSELHKICQKRMNIPRPSFTDMNAAAAKALASVLLPTDGPQGRREGAGGDGAVGGGGGAFGGFGGFEEEAKPGALTDICQHLCRHPGYKLLSLRSLPQVPAGVSEFGTFNWASILKWLRQMSITGWQTDEGMDWSVSAPHSTGSWPCGKSIANYLVLRGKGAAGVDTSLFRDSKLYSARATDPLRVATSQTSFFQHEAAASLLSNCQTCVGPASRMLERAELMLQAGAYVHQYEKCGLERTDFREAFAAVGGAIGRYAAL